MKYDKFEETKIKMVMKLRGLTREDAIRALLLGKPQKKREAPKSSMNCGGNFKLSAKDFFDQDDKMIPVEEFFV